MNQNDEIKRMRALKVYRDLLSYIDEKGWKCNSDEETLSPESADVYQPWNV